MNTLLPFDYSFFLLWVVLLPSKRLLLSNTLSNDSSASRQYAWDELSSSSLHRAPDPVHTGLVSQPSFLRNASSCVFYWTWISNPSFLHPLVIIFFILPEPTNLEVLLTFSGPLIFSSPSQYSSQINLDPWGMQNVSFTLTDFCLPCM